MGFGVRPYPHLAGHGLLERLQVALEGVEVEDERRGVDLLEDAPAAGALEPGHELGPEDVDLPVQDPAPIADLTLLGLELVLQLLQLLVGHGAEIGQGFHRSLAFLG